MYRETPLNIKGSLPLLILHLLESGPSHGYSIAKEIKERSEGVLDFKEGTLYPTLHNLEKQNYIESYKSKYEGRIRRYYQLTEVGKAALEQEMQAWQTYTQAVSVVLGQKD